MKTTLLALAISLVSYQAIAASADTMAFIASNKLVASAIAEKEGATNQARCGSDWKAKKADLSKDGWTWPRYYSACNSALKGK